MQRNTIASKVTKRDTLLTFSRRSATARKERIRDVRIASDQVTIVTNSNTYKLDPLARVSIEAR